MNPGEKYQKKRENFITKTQEYFEFLFLEFNYEPPVYSFYEQANGTIISDKFEYKGKKDNILISNAYHPVDYGFEINRLDLKSGKSEMLQYLVKEKQDLNQQYLKEQADILRKMYPS